MSLLNLSQLNERAIFQRMSAPVKKIIYECLNKITPTCDKYDRYDHYDHYDHYVDEPRYEHYRDSSRPTK